MFIDLLRAFVMYELMFEFDILFEMNIFVDSVVFVLINVVI